MVTAFKQHMLLQVSLFLQEGIQGPDGKILLPIPLPHNPSDVQPGTATLLSSMVGVIGLFTGVVL